MMTIIPETHRALLIRYYYTFYYYNHMADISAWWNIGPRGYYPSRVTCFSIYIYSSKLMVIY